MLRLLKERKLDMEKDKAMDFEAFQRALVPQRIRTWQIIYAALLAGATVFAGIVLLLYIQQPRAAAAEPADASFLRILTMVHVAIAAGCYMAAFAVSRFFAGDKGLEFVQRNAGGLTEDGGLQASLYLQAVFTGAIIRAALMEGPALFGVIACLMGVTEGVIPQQPVYWLNLFSYVIFAGMVVWTFPTRQRLEDRFKDRFGIL